MVHMTKTLKRRTVVKNRCRFVLFLISVALLLNLFFIGLVVPSTSKADLKQEPVIVTVVKGDTLWSIAEKHYGGRGDIRKYVYDIKKANNLSSSRLAIGQELILPME